MKENEYSSLVKKHSPPSPKIKNFLWAFFIGGTICAIGQILFEILGSFNIPEITVKTAVPIILVLLAGLLTGIGVFDKIAKCAGAGTLVPITGFANAVVSPAVEFKSEGFIMGVGVNIFKIAGPVIAYGTAASVLYGIIYWIIKNFRG